MAALEAATAVGPVVVAAVEAEELAVVVDVVLGLLSWIAVTVPSKDASSTDVAPSHSFSSHTPALYT